MGGFYYFDGDTPLHPASADDIKFVVQNSEGMPDLPNKDDINDKSKGDGFSKTVTVLQTLWFVMQCIARAIEGLTITKLEIVTLAYTAISIAMYRFWWSKPLSVSRPIRLKKIPSSTSSPDGEIALNSRVEATPRSADSHGESSSTPTEVKDDWRHAVTQFIKAVVGTQDDEVNLSRLSQVPTFYAGKPMEHQVLFADAIALIFAMIFGAVHCIAWSFMFPSHTEKLLWRISAVALVGVPAIYIVFVVLIACEVDWLAKPTLLLSTVGIPFYLLARVTLLVLAFTTLRDLPPNAYETIHWMTFIPHV